MKRMKRGIAIVATLAAITALCLCMAGCGGSNTSASTAESTAASTASESASGDAATLSIAYQYGLSYAPAVIAKEQGLIEKAYKEATGKELTIEWNQMSSGADINTGITSGSLQVGFMGIGPAITGVATGLDYKIFTNLSGQEHSLITNDSSIKSLEDLVGSDKQIALVNIGSIQHIILAKALANSGLDPHALDSNIVVMKHPDGMSALQSGNVACHLTSSPYTFTERADSSLTELTEVNKAWTKDDSFIVGVASTELQQNAELYQALCDGIAAGMALINDDAKQAAEILCEFDGIDAETELSYLEQGSYTAETHNLFNMATFMSENSFIDKEIASYNDLVFDNVKGD